VSALPKTLELSAQVKLADVKLVQHKYITLLTVLFLFRQCVVQGLRLLAERLELAHDFGAAHSINSGEVPDLAAEINRICQGVR